MPALPRQQSSSRQSPRKRPGVAPRYVQVEASLRILLETGGYRPGDKLPTEPVLAQQLNVSRATLREALRSFEQQGIIRRKQGVGTFLNPQPTYIDSGLEVLDSIEMLFTNREIAASASQRRIEEEKALPKAASRLACAEGTPLTSLRSTYTVNQTAAAYLMEIVPAAHISTETAHETTTSLLHVLLTSGEGPPPAYGISHIAPVLGTPEIISALNIPEETPIFLLEQTVFNRENRPCYYARNYYIPKVFNFHIVRRVQSNHKP